MLCRHSREQAYNFIQILILKDNQECTCIIIWFTVMPDRSYNLTPKEENITWYFLSIFFKKNIKNVDNALFWIMPSTYWNICAFGILFWWLAREIIDWSMYWKIAVMTIYKYMCFWYCVFYFCNKSFSEWRITYFVFIYCWRENRFLYFICQQQFDQHKLTGVLLKEQCIHALLSPHNNVCMAMFM